MLFKVYEYIFIVAYHCYKEEQLLRIAFCFPGHYSAVKMGFTLKEKIAPGAANSFL